MARTQTKLVRNLTKDERRACGRLNLRSNGEMMYALHEHPEGRVWMIWEDGRLQAWALTFPQKKHRIVHTYVRYSERRRGLGTRLMRAVNRREAVKACPHDFASSCFYDLFDMPAAYGYHYSMN